MALEATAKEIRRNECGMTNEQAQEAFNMLNEFTYGKMTKTEACDALGINRQKFDRLVDRGVIPRGEHSYKGCHAVFWMRNVINKLKGKIR